MMHRTLQDIMISLKKTTTGDCSVTMCWSNIKTLQLEKETIVNEKVFGETCSSYFSIKNWMGDFTSQSVNNSMLANVSFKG